MNGELPDRGNLKFLMSVQIFLQGKILGVEQFLLTSSSDMDGAAHWVALLSEILPRALLAEFGLSKILLGSSGGEQFLLVLPIELRSQAEEFLHHASAHIEQISAGAMKLVWAVTENLGDWTVVRKRLNEEMVRKLGAPAAATTPEFFTPFSAETGNRTSDYFRSELGRRLREAESVGWSPEEPAYVHVGSGKHLFPITSSIEGVPYARHAALTDDGMSLATPDDLALRSQGRKVWAVLRGDVDSFGVRLRRAASIEEHIQLSVMMKQFFAGELEVLCSMPEFWRKVTLLYSGGDDFAVYGAWDALIGLAGEVHRLFQRFAEQNLKDFPGPEGKTITMSLAIARDEHATLPAVFEEAGHGLETAKSSGKDCFWLFGRTLEWKHLNDASDAKDSMVRMVKEFGVSPQFLYELGSFYRDSLQSGIGRARNMRLERPWRFHRRLQKVLGSRGGKEFQKLRTEMISEFTGRNAAQVRLRPAGRVALEWARLQTM